jgi:hypothetical protein
MGADGRVERSENVGSGYTKLLILLEFPPVLGFAINLKKG